MGRKRPQTKQPVRSPQKHRGFGHRKRRLNPEPGNRMDDSFELLARVAAEDPRLFVRSRGDIMVSFVEILNMIRFRF